MQRKIRYSRLPRSSALFLSAFLLIAAPTAFAASLDEAKAAGLVGEAPDGYVHLVDKGAPADVKTLVKEVNDQRRLKYEEIAKQRGASVEDVAALAGAKLVERTPPGQYVLDTSAAWRKK